MKTPIQITKPKGFFVGDSVIKFVSNNSPCSLHPSPLCPLLPSVISNVIIQSKGYPLTSNQDVLVRPFVMSYVRRLNKVGPRSLDPINMGLEVVRNQFPTGTLLQLRVHEDRPRTSVYSRVEGRDFYFLDHSVSFPLLLVSPQSCPRCRRRNPSNVLSNRKRSSF